MTEPPTGTPTNQTPPPRPSEEIADRFVSALEMRVEASLTSALGALPQFNDPAQVVTDDQQRLIDTLRGAQTAAARC